MARPDKFPVEIIHSTDNIINLPVEAHRRISHIMSQKSEEFDNLVRRHWTEQFSFGEQYNLGLDLVIEVMEEMGYDIEEY